MPVTFLKTIRFLKTDTFI